VRLQIPAIGTRLRTGAVIVLLAGMSVFGHSSSKAAETVGVSDDEIMNVVKKHCVTCHSETPSHNMLLGQPPPKGVVLETIDEVRQFAPRIEIQVAQKKLMPLGNETGMTDQERARFHDWIMTNRSPKVGTGGAEGVDFSVNGSRLPMN
jgi:uncharacterized membrane protein